MSVTGKRGIGIPTILLHDAEGTIVTIELKNGETYRGLLDESEDNMNCVMKNVMKTDTNGNTSQLELCYLRGSQILMIIIPDMLKRAPMFKRLTVWKKYKGAIPPLGQGDHLEGGAGGPRGQAAAIIRKAAARRDNMGKGGKGFGGKGFGGKGGFGGGMGRY